MRTFETSQANSSQHSLIYTRQQSGMSIGKAWSPRTSSSSLVPCRDTFDQAVSTHLRSRHPVGYSSKCSGLQSTQPSNELLPITSECENMPGEYSEKVRVPVQSR